MAKQPVFLFNSSANPLNSNCFFAPYSLENSGTTQNPSVLHMLASVVSHVSGIIFIPDAYVGTPELVIPWTSETTANTVDFKFRHRTVVAADDLDISTSPAEREDTSLNTTGPAASSRFVETVISLTTTDIAKNKYMYYEFERDGVTDDKADTITVWRPYFRFSDA